jgi:DNA-binding HxlR family transcriptional regulator
MLKFHRTAGEFAGDSAENHELRRAIPAVAEKMLIQQLRQMERDSVVRRFVHHQVAPKVEYSLTSWGQALCPALDSLLTWVDSETRDGTRDNGPSVTHSGDGSLGPRSRADYTRE